MVRSQRKERRGHGEAQEKPRQGSAPSGTEEKNERRMPLGRNKGPGSCTHQGRGRCRRGKKRLLDRGWRQGTHRCGGDPGRGVF